MITEEEKKQFLKNEEKLWDMAALTVASSLSSQYNFDHDVYTEVAQKAYNMADALMIERRKRLKAPRKF